MEQFMEKIKARLLSEEQIKEKYGLKKSNAIVLFVMMILVCVGFILHTICTISQLTAGACQLIPNVVQFMCLVGIILYGVRNYKKPEVYFKGLVYAISISLVAAVLRGGNIINTVCLTLCYGGFTLYVVRMSDPEKSKKLLFSIFGLSVIGAIFAAVTATGFSAKMVTHAVPLLTGSLLIIHMAHFRKKDEEDRPRRPVYTFTSAPDVPAWSSFMKPASEETADEKTNEAEETGTDAETPEESDDVQYIPSDDPDADAAEEPADETAGPDSTEE